MNDLDRFASDWIACHRAAFDRETLRLRSEGLWLFLAALSTSCALGALVRLFL